MRAVTTDVVGLSGAVSAARYSPGAMRVAGEREPWELSTSIVLVLETGRPEASLGITYTYVWDVPSAGRVSYITPTLEVPGSTGWVDGFSWVCMA